ncbi:MAG: MoxR family ATPase, partial [Planctomycetes bacterium]|nr:MoxR family ATPase [Planctomycetota bacterium]
GTYPLPEAQLDRFLLRIELGYPRADDEARILAEQIREHPIVGLKPVMEVEGLLAIQADVREVRAGPEVLRYIVELVQATRASPELRLGVSPRGGLALLRASQAHSLLQGVRFVTPDSVKAVAPHVLSHRVLLDPQREYAGLSKRKVIEKVLAEVPVPAVPHDALVRPAAS